MDKVNAIYEVECREHHVKYVGETMRPLKMRALEHRVVNNKEAKKSHTLGWRKKNESEEREEEEDETVRRSNRLGRKERKDYKQMNEGEKIVMTEGATEPAKHAYKYQTEHTEESMTIKAIGYEPNLRRRQVKEAIEIFKRKPQLNEDPGKAKIFPMFKDVVRKEQEERNTQKGGKERSVSAGRVMGEKDKQREKILADSELDETIPYIGEEADSDSGDIDITVETVGQEDRGSKHETEINGNLGVMADFPCSDP